MSAPLICMMGSNMNGKRGEAMVVAPQDQGRGGVGKAHGQGANLNKPCSSWAHKGASNEVTINDRLLQSLQCHASNL